ncbi:hypothetical protein DFR70_11897 [Nocardia tenerifensis]|uniref:Uncharacterized protein n=1 Tax=Nocardia tenerifensis TaxID=228006 RepID=A0A318JVM0_9NOCA|nr:hypothetical protein DFR70_11897 [Nocardia tenerifensis]
MDLSHTLIEASHGPIRPLDTPAFAKSSAVARNILDNPAALAVRHKITDGPGRPQWALLPSGSPTDTVRVDFSFRYRIFPGCEAFSR